MKAWMAALWREQTRRRRLAAIAGLAAAFCGLSFWLADDMERAGPASLEEAAAGKPAPAGYEKPILPRGFRAAPAALCDPFLLARPQRRPAVQEPPARRTKDGRGGGPKAGGRPVLKGIAVGAGRRAAIVEYRGRSRLYEESEKVGGYRIVEIGAAYVRAAGRGGAEQWTVGR